MTGTYSFKLGITSGDPRPRLHKHQLDGYSAVPRLFTGLPDGEKRLAITNHDTRFGRLGDQSLELFRKKWNAYWTRVVPDE